MEMLDHIWLAMGSILWVGFLRAHYSRIHDERFFAFKMLFSLRKRKEQKATKEVAEG